MAEMLGKAQYLILQEGGVDDAMLLYASLLKEHPEDVGIRHNHSLCYEIKEDFATALRGYMANIKVCSRYTPSVLGAYNCLRHLHSAAILNGVSQGSHVQLARQRLQFLQQFVHLSNNHVQLQLLLSEAQFSCGRLDYNPQAIQTFVEAIESAQGWHQTESYIQCYYENFNNSRYYMLHPPRPPPVMNLPPSCHVIIMVASQGYVHMMLNSLYSMHQNCPHLSEFVHVYCADAASYDEVPAFVHRHLLMDRPDTAVLRIYNEPVFNQLVNLKIQIVQWLLQHNIGVLCADLDVIWLKDPMPLVIDSKEAVFQQDLNNMACTGFFFVRPTADNCELFDNSRYPPDCGDQPVVNWMLQHRYRGEWQYFDVGRVIHGACAPTEDTYIMHYNNIAGPDKLQRMLENEHWFMAHLMGYQDQIMVETAAFRLPPHTSVGYAGPWIEQLFFEHYTKLRPEDQPARIYLPIYWTELMIQDHAKLEQALKFVASLPKDYDFFTVIQHSDGIELPANILVFASGRPQDGQICIPLLKQEKRHNRATKLHNICFCGTITSNNDPFGVRTDTIDVCKSMDGFMQYEGPDWETRMASSKFSLCPRGAGPTSFRLVESINIGCVPVVIWSDQPGDCSGPVLPYADELDWESFSIVVSHLNIGGIAERLHRYPELHANLMKVRHYFTTDHVLHYIIRKCVENDA